MHKLFIREPSGLYVPLWMRLIFPATRDKTDMTAFIYLCEFNA